MGQDYKGDLDPNYWASCSCGEYHVIGSSTEEVQDKINEHFVNNLKSHTRSTSIGGYNSYVIHIPIKPKWYQRIFEGIRNKLHNP